MDHKERCKELKGLRKVLADKLGIDLHQRECTYEGECSGTCPKCAKEENILRKALLSGTVALTAVTLSACGPETDGGEQPTAKERIEARKKADGCKTTKENKNDNNGKKGTKNGGEDPEPLAGDVAEPEPDLIEEGEEPYYIDELEGDVEFKFQDDEILEKCRTYSGAPEVEIDHYEDGKYVVHCYENVDNEEESHASTWDWITVDPYTGDAVDFEGNEFNIYDY